MPNVRLKLDQFALDALSQIAGEEDISLGQVIRDAVKRDLFRRERAKRAVRPDEQLVAPLRSLLADDFAYADTWEDLLRRLRRKGFNLAEAGGGIILIDLNGTRLCKGSDLGYSYGRLLRRLGRPFPLRSLPGPKRFKGGRAKLVNEICSESAAPSTRPDPQQQAPDPPPPSLY